MSWCDLPLICVPDTKNSLQNGCFLSNYRVVANSVILHEKPKSALAASRLKNTPSIIPKRGLRSAQRSVSMGPLALYSTEFS